MKATMASGKKQPVLFIIDRLIGGAGKVLLDVAGSLDADRFEAHVICFFKTSTTATTSAWNESVQWNSDQIRLNYFFETKPRLVNINPVNDVWLTLRLVYRLWCTIRGMERNTILVSFLEPPSICVILTKWLGIRNKTVVSLHVNESEHYKAIFPDGLTRYIQSALLRRVGRKADAVLFPSEGARLDFIRHFNASPSKTIALPNPIQINEIVKLAALPLPSHIQIPSGRTIFCHVGRLDPQKNHQLLIKACALLRRRHENFTVICAGDGPYEETIRKMIGQEGLGGHVKLVGSLTNPYALMARSRALLFTSHYEGFSLVLAEALAIGTACISVDCPSGPAEVLSNGEYGLLVPPDDPKAFADAMHEVISNDGLVQTLMEKGRKRAEDFAIDRVAKRWEEVICR